jgi:hypothetical protein
MSVRVSKFAIAVVLPAALALLSLSEPAQAQRRSIQSVGRMSGQCGSGQQSQLQTQQRNQLSALRQMQLTGALPQSQQLTGLQPQVQQLIALQQQQLAALQQQIALLQAQQLGAAQQQQLDAWQRQLDALQRKLNAVQAQNGQ